MSLPFIYSSDDGRVIVLDLPGSISWAQGAQSHLLSVEAIRYPFSTPEPKGQKLSQLRDAVPVDERRYWESIEAAIDVALVEARQHLARQHWHLSRAISDNSASTTLPVRQDNDDGAVCKSLPPPLILAHGINEFNRLCSVQPSIVHNPNNEAVDIQIVDLGRFHIPSRSTFLMTTIEQGISSFKTATRTLWPDIRKACQKHIVFDLVLLDPPWGNRSVRNSKAYRSEDDQGAHPFEETIPIVENYLATTGYAAVWVTNKVKVRERVISAFAELNLYLVEEWIWVKVTATGEPVMPLNGFWRKPYEILLLFRSQIPTHSLKRKILFAVPDLHSRKPSLKCLFDSILPEQCQVLELFARSLTSGWWSWGDEVLKFQHESCWIAAVSDDHQREKQLT